MVALRQVWEKSEFVTRGPSKLAKQPNNRKTVAHIINPRENHTVRPCHWFSMTCCLYPVCSIPYHLSKLSTICSWDRQWTLVCIEMKVPCQLACINESQHRNPWEASKTWAVQQEGARDVYLDPLSAPCSPSHYCKARAQAPQGPFCALYIFWTFMEQMISLCTLF